MSDTRAVSETPAVSVVSPGTADTAVVLATTAGDNGRPAALLPWSDATVVERLIGQLEGLGVRTTVVLARPAFQAAVQEAVGPAVEVRACASPREDLRAIAEVVEAAAEAVLIVYGDIVTHADALEGLITNPRAGTGILAGGRRRRLAFRFQARRGWLVSAASPYHSVRNPNGTFLGVLRVAHGDRAALLAAAERLEPLVADVPARWQEELARKVQRWRLAVASLAATGEEEGGDDFASPEEREEVDDARAEDIPAVGPLSAEDEARLRTRVAAAPDDAAALLVVGLVRAGVRVTPVYLRRLFWSRTLSADAAAHAARRITEYDLDRLRLESAVKSTDGFFTTFFVSPYSKYIARWAARRGLTPNQVTAVSMAIGAVAAAAFATGERAGLIAGAVLLQVSFTADCVDGQLARYTRQFSVLGAWLDSVFDRTKEYLASAGLAIGSAHMGDPVWTLACAALTLQTVRHTSDFSYMAMRAQGFRAAPQPPLEQSLDAAGAAADARRRARAAAAASSGAAAPPNRPLASRLLLAWQSLDRSRSLRWVKRMLAFPIGERFAVLSITAALFTPRTTFIALLACSSVALLYTQTGRLLRSLR